MKKLDENNDGVVAEPLELCTHFLQKRGPRATESGVTSTLREDSNSRTSKTPVTDVSCISNEFDKLNQKNASSWLEKRISVFSSVCEICKN